MDLVKTDIGQWGFDFPPTSAQDRKENKMNTSTVEYEEHLKKKINRVRDHIGKNKSKLKRLENEVKLVRERRKKQERKEEK